jgi:hypothetical protein
MINGQAASKLNLLSVLRQHKSLLRKISIEVFYLIRRAFFLQSNKFLLRLISEAS